MAAKTFEEIMKFNPYHDARGRFATSGSATSFTYSPGKSRAHDLAIERQKERMASLMPSEAQAKTLKGIENRTRNLKKEQFRVVDRDGNVIMEKQGDKHSVNFSVGEARDNFPGNITIHNHPDGGTFSSADLSAIGYGAKEIRAAAPEGTYILRNMRHGAKYDAAKEKTWYEMREDIDAATEGFKTHRQIKSEVRKPFDAQSDPLAKKWVERKDAGASQDELNKIAAEFTAMVDSFRPQIEAAARKAYVDQFHHWYKSNAGNYGLEYEFIPVKSRARKSAMLDEIIEVIGKSDDDIVLDLKMHQDVEEMTDAIIEEMKAAFPAVQKSDNDVKILKADEDKRVVFGWASVAITVDGEQLEDRQQDMIDPEDLEEAAYEYVLNFRDTGEEHISSMRKKGKLVESCVFTEEKQRAMGIPPGTLPIGWWIGFKISDDDAWERVKNGTYRMFSIEGKANREPVEKALRNFEEFPGFWEWLEENMDATKEDERAAMEYYGGKTHKKEREGSVAKTFDEILGSGSARTIEKSAPDRFDTIVEVGKADRFDHLVEVEKFNPYHDSRGRFASANGATSFTYSPGKSNAHDLAIARAAAKEKVAKAKEAEPKLTGMMQECAKAAGGEMVGLKYAVKGEDSLTRKIKTEMGKNGSDVKAAVADMKDVNRYTMQLGEDNFLSGYESTMKTLQSQGHEVVRVKNSLGDPTAPYRGVNTNIKSPDGSIWELQFHTAKSLEVKEVNHKLYETQRLDKTPADKRAELGRQMAQNAASIPSPKGIEKIQPLNKL